MMNDSVVVQASWINDAEFAGYFLAMANGWYETAGIDIVHRPGRSGLVPERALLAPDSPATIALSSPESVAQTVIETGAPLRIIAAQFQRSPLALVSAADRRIDTVEAMAGQTIAVPPANRPLLEWLIGTRPDAGLVRLVDYDHDVQRLARGAVDAFVDFPVDAVLDYRRSGLVPHVVALSDLGASLCNNAVVVLEQTLLDSRDMLERWLSASRKGWQANAADPDATISQLWGTHIQSPRALADECAANRIFLDHMGAPDAYLAMSRQSVAANTAVLDAISLPASSLFTQLTTSDMDKPA